MKGDFPYVAAYPPQYLVTEGANRSFTVEPYAIDGRMPDELSRNSEERKILIEAYRGMRNCFGDTLFFSEPVRSSSFVFRSEREFLQRYDERFAWMVHFFQCAVRESSLYPERYAGFLFVRPWSVHVREALQEPAYRSSSLSKTQNPDDLTPEDLCWNGNISEDMVAAPAICEGYLRPPLSLVRSPYFSQCLDFYAQPYGVLPFLSIPFFSSHFGAACGHCMGATAFLMSRFTTILSPYELAVAASGIAADMYHGVSEVTTEEKGSNENQMFEISKLILNTLPHVARIRCFATAHVECYFNPRYRDQPGFLSSQDEAEFSEMLCTYLYQGFPVLYLVDAENLYLDVPDEELCVDSKAPYTRPDKYHVILIHGVGRPRPGESHTFIFSDSTDLNRHGDVFHQASCRRLWAARLRPDPAHIPREIQQRDLPPDQHKHAAVFVVCLPQDFEYKFTTIKHETMDAMQKASREHGSRPERSPRIIMRDRSQLRGYLIQRVYGDLDRRLLTTPTFLSSVRRFREELRSLDIPSHLWLIEEYQPERDLHRGVPPPASIENESFESERPNIADSTGIRGENSRLVQGLIRDIRRGGGVTGSYSPALGKIMVRGLTRSGYEKEVTVSQCDTGITVDWQLIGAS